MGIHRGRGISARRDRRGESGAALVEFALVSPVLFLIVAAIIDFGLTFSDLIAVRSGVGQGARQGVVANFGSSCTLNAFTTTPSANVQHLMCTVKNRVGIAPHSRVYVKVVFNPTGSANYKVANGLLVCAQTPMTSLTGLTSPFLNGRFLKTKVQMSIEQISGTAETEGAEAAPPGGSWSWCT